MPRYFFDFTDGGFSGHDKFGTKLPDVDASAREEVGALANISKDVRQQYQDRVLALDVRDNSSNTVLNVTLRLEVTWIPARCRHRGHGHGVGDDHGDVDDRGRERPWCAVVFPGNLDSVP